MKYNYSDIPEVTIRRLSFYFHILKCLKQNNVEFISSKQLASLAHTNAVSVRKDFSYFGEFGKKHIGYNVNFLMKSIMKILNISKSNPYIIVGYGNLGTAISFFPGFKEDNFVLKGIFDINKKKIGKEPIKGVKIMHIDEVGNFVKSNKIKFAVLSTPMNVSQLVAEKLAKSGIRGILNMTGRHIRVPSSTLFFDINIVTGLEWLSYFISRKGDKDR